MVRRDMHHSATALLLLGGLLLADAPASAKRRPGADHAVPVAVVARPVPLREAENSIARREGGARLQFGAESGLLRDFYLHSPARGAVSAAAPADVARQFLVDKAPRLGVDATRLAETLRLDSTRETPSGTHFRWQQVVDGVPVFRGDLVLKVSPRGDVSSLHSRIVPGISLATRPEVDATRAVAIGVAAVRPTGKALGDFTAELNIVSFESGPRLTWLVSVPVEAPMGDWRVYVDAQNGAILGAEDRMVYADGTGQVFDPDPRAKMNDPSLIDNNDADSAVPFPAAYDQRPLLGITNTAGTYSLSGPYVAIQEFESPVVAPVTTSDPNAFLFQRNPSAFEDVNVYFHIDQNQRYIQSLGFTNINNRVQLVDTHGLSGADNSHYVPSTKRLAFGEGGVDDAEDADVVIHEYGHSIQDNIVPGWGGGQEGAMGEGFGDYWAGSYSTRVFPTFQPNFVFTWDGHNEFWDGRVLVDSTLHYPEDCCGEVHDSGTLWCSGITDCLRRLGHTVMDRLVLDHHFALGTSATMADAANQIIQSDIDLYGGAHLSTLVPVFGFWGFIDPEDFIPTIAHSPLSDTEDTTGPYTVLAVISSAQPLNPAALRVVWGIGALTDTLTLTPTANPGEYSATIPGPLSNVDVRYYITAADSAGGTATDPADAPVGYHEFHIGADTTPPVIVHTPLADFPLLGWPANVNATVTDNLGVNADSVLVGWTLNGATQAGFPLARVGLTDSYTGAFPAVSVAIGDTVRYHLEAQDTATVPNGARHPGVGEHAFVIIDVLGLVLVLDDDDVAKKGHGTKELSVGDSKTATVTVNAPLQNPGDVGLSASDIASILNGIGYLATVESAASSNSATWSNYDLLVHSSGGNESPLTNPGYRAALEAYAAGGGKLLVEGGEVVYDCASTPGYPSFAANVLHSVDWDADNAGALTRLPAQATHPIATIPNALPVTLAIAYSSYGSEDSFKPAAPAYIVYGVTAQAGNGGILVYDPTVPPQSAQIVVFGFDFKDLSDLATRSALLENTAAYLLAAEPPADGGLTGHAYLGNAQTHNGVTVTLSPGGASTTTDVGGNFSFSGLYPGIYTVTASRTGYQPASLASVVNAATVTADQDLLLYPVPEVQYCVSPGLAIPDNNATGISSTQTLTETWAVQDVRVTVNITHTYQGDLTLDLTHGARTVRLRNRTGGSSDNIIGTFPTTLTVDGPGTLADFIGDPAAGAWTLTVADRANLDTGTLVSWCLNLRGPADTQAGTEAGDRPPRIAELWQSQPNPLGARGTTIRFALPKRSAATLLVYDVAGRLVRSLVEGTIDSGVHGVSWDGRDDRGQRVAAGMYVYRLQADGVDLKQKLVVIH